MEGDIFSFESSNAQGCQLTEETEEEIPPGTQSHSKIRLRGKGVKHMNSYGYGDHYVHVQISVPKSPNETQRALLLALAEEDSPRITGTVRGMEKTTGGRLKSSSGELTYLMMALRNVLYPFNTPSSSSSNSSTTVNSSTTTNNTENSAGKRYDSAGASKAQAAEPKRDYKYEDFFKS